MATVREKRERPERAAVMAGWMELVVRWVRSRRLRTVGERTEVRDSKERRG